MSLWCVASVVAVVGSAGAQTVIIDNTDPGFSVLSETWSTTSITGQFGSDYRFRSTTQATGEVEWRPLLTQPGRYRVETWYRSANDRPVDTPYTVYHASGATPVPINQRLNGSQWVVLGEFDFVAGDVGRVVLSTAADPGQTVVADAVRFVYQGEPGALVPEMRACWLTHYKYLGLNEAGLRQVAQNIKAGHMNTVYIAAYSGTTVYWPSQAYRAAGGNWGSSTIDYCDRLVDIFKDEGLTVGAWFEYGMALGYANHPIAVANPDWLARDAGGDPVTGENGGFVFISPGHPAAMQMLADMVTELAENYNFDDIQIDRYRWGRKSTGREYGYEQVTKDLYRATYGVDPPSNINNSTWVRFRERLVNDAVQQSYDAIKAANPHIIVSSAPVGYYGFDQHMQIWSDWTNGGYMDLVMPQMYKTSLGAFQTEFNLQLSEAGAHTDKLAVGYRASDTTDWTLVAQQMNYARNAGINSGTLWVYHSYTSQVAIQDEIDNLPTAGQPWEQLAYNPYVSDRMLQIVIDNDDRLSGEYDEVGSWFFSGQPDYFRFDSRVAQGPLAHTATFSAAVPKSGRFEAFVWYSASGNRNPAAEYTIEHYNGSTSASVDQRAMGGQWVSVGEYILEAGDLAPRMTVTTAGSGSGVYTSADAIKLTLVGYALGDVDGDGDVDAADHASFDDCYTGPTGAGSAACEAFDFDDDGDFDVRDVADYQTRYADA